jgi:glycosyltransferase involved in cell wall biosynthesis
LGRISPLKGTHIAIEVAQQCDIDLIIAGNVSAEEGASEYFQVEIAPRLSERIQWIGEVSDSQKAKLCGGALALLFPIQWPEPFGLVMIESMFCGTPVIAFGCGSVPEIVEHEKTGYIVRDVEEMVQAVSRVDQISRAACAKIARERFSASIMVGRYIDLYEKLLMSNNERACLQLAS